jgi:FAD dependent monooxygenase
MGYMCGVCERMKFLRSLYDQLENKSSILLKKKAVEILHTDHGVKVICADGTEVSGHIVIGADGIHSRTRQAMQKHIEDEGRPELIEKDKRCKPTQHFFPPTLVNKL